MSLIRCQSLSREASGAFMSGILVDAATRPPASIAGPDRAVGRLRLAGRGLFLHRLFLLGHAVVLLRHGIVLLHRAVLLHHVGAHGVLLHHGVVLLHAVRLGRRHVVLALLQGHAAF